STEGDGRDAEGLPPGGTHRGGEPFPQPESVEGHLREGPLPPLPAPWLPSRHPDRHGARDLPPPSPPAAEGQSLRELDVDAAPEGGGAVRNAGNSPADLRSGAPVARSRAAVELPQPGKVSGPASRSAADGPAARPAIGPGL